MYHLASRFTPLKYTPSWYDIVLEQGRRRRRKKETKKNKSTHVSTTVEKVFRLRSRDRIFHREDRGCNERIFNESFYQRASSLLLLPCVRPLHANNIFPGGCANRPIFFFLFFLFSPPSRNHDRSDANSSDDLYKARVRLVFRPRLFIGRRRRGSAKTANISLAQSFSRAAFRNSGASIWAVDRHLFIRFAARWAPLFPLFFSFSPPLFLPRAPMAATKLILDRGDEGWGGPRGLGPTNSFRSQWDAASWRKGRKGDDSRWGCSAPRPHLRRGLS